MFCVRWLDFKCMCVRVLQTGNSSSLVFAMYFGLKISSLKNV